MYRFLTLIFSLCSLAIEVQAAASDRVTISGEVRDKVTNEVIVGASVVVNEGALWAVTDSRGCFHIDGVFAGDGEMIISYLGYVSYKSPISEVSKKIELAPCSLAIDEVVVIAQNTNRDINTSYTIGREALKHTQVTDISQIEALLPGGKTRNSDLTSASPFSIRDGGSSIGNSAFGTAVEVDGVRLSNNGSFGSLDGVDTRSVAVENIESIEVITGVPSVEYGDINSGVVKIKTRRGASPLNTTLTINPKTYMVSASKGIRLDDKGSTLNVSGEWARATSSLVSPYDSYTRRGASALYATTLRDDLRFEIGTAINIGGSNSEDDPDAYTGEYTKGRDNVLRVNTSFEWLANRSWLTNLKFDLSVNYNDKRVHNHVYYSYASQQPSVDSTEEGYFMASQLPYSYFADGITDSKELNLAGAIKYSLSHRLGGMSGRFKAGVQWKMTGNMGRGSYYEESAVAPSGFRERDYSSYPFMHNVSFYAEERLTIPIGVTSLSLISGVRVESLFVDGAEYGNTTSLSPRFNGALKINNNLTVRGGWGITEKLPSYYVLYPEQEYRDILSFGATYNNNEAFYSYYTQPYKLESNPNLKWQRNRNSEVGIDAKIGGVKLAVTGYFNKSVGAYCYSSYYTPFSYNTFVLPSGYTMPSIPGIRVDSQTGDIYVRDLSDPSSSWRSMDLNITNTTFSKTTYSDNGADVIRKGVEVVVDFPQIKPLKTEIRFDASYSNVSYMDSSLSYSYTSGLSHTTESGKSYQYVGIYATGNGSSSAMYNGQVSNKIDANITAVTHIPRARLIVSCRVEMSLYNRWQYKSEYNGREYAFNSDEYGNPTGGSIYDGDSYTSIYPIKYMDTQGVIHDFTEEDAANPNFANLIRTSSNAYSFNRGGYAPYVSANISVTKEIGDSIALSFHANNFTNSRKAVESYSTGVSAIFTPSFYYGLTCRVKF